MRYRRHAPSHAAHNFKGALTREPLQREETERRLRSQHHLMSRPRDGRAYLLSTLPQHLLVRRYSFTALLFFFLSVQHINERSH
jgi:hypothetical protein